MQVCDAARLEAVNLTLFYVPFLSNADGATVRAYLRGKAVMAYLVLGRVLRNGSCGRRGSDRSGLGGCLCCRMRRGMGGWGWVALSQGLFTVIILGNPKVEGYVKLKPLNES